MSGSKFTLTEAERAELDALIALSKEGNSPENEAAFWEAFKALSEGTREKFLAMAVMGMTVMGAASEIVKFLDQISGVNPDTNPTKDA